MRIAYLYDDNEHKGGAELCAEECIAAAPEWAEVVACHGNKIATDVDGYVVGNCVTSTRRVIQRLRGKPLVKRVHDTWLRGAPEIRDWMLESAKLVLFSGPLHREVFPWPVSAPTAMLPSAIDLKPFFDAAENAPPPASRTGTMWLGRLFKGKGLEAARVWAAENQVELDVYGFGALDEKVRPPAYYCGPVSYDRVPHLMAQYRTFVFLPDIPEPYGRAVVEAWAAGCRLITNNNVGALWWLQNNKLDEITTAAELFWKECEAVFL